MKAGKILTRLSIGSFLLVTVLGFVVTNAGAAPVLTVYTDRNAWEAAVGGFFLEQNFDSFVNAASYESAPVDVGDFSVGVSGTTYGFDWHNIGPVSNGNNVNGTPQINAATGPVGGTSLSFDFPIAAFGASWQGISDDRTTSFNIDGTLLAIPNLNGGFFGFTSDTPFTTAFLFLSSGEPDGFGIDNVVYSASAAPVPEPASLLLLGTGLGVIGLAAWRKRK